MNYYLQIIRFLLEIKLHIHSIIAYIYCNLHRHVISAFGGKKYFYPRGGDADVSIEWVHRIMTEYYKTKLPDLKSVKLERSIFGGFTGEMFKILLEWSDAPHSLNADLPTSLVVKTYQTDYSSMTFSLFNGSVRERLIYHHFKDKIGDTLPIIYYSRGSFFAGDYLIVMEDLSPKAISSSKILGNQCFGRVEIPDYLQISEVDFLKKTVISIADIHATFWRDKSLLNLKFLKGTQWLKGRDRARWEIAMNFINKNWKCLMDAVKAGKTKVKYSNEVISAMNKFLSNTSWDNFQNNVDITKKNTCFTLCHGDFHAGNSLWGYNSLSVTPNIFFVDWAEASVICPISDIAQYFISNASIELRRKEEKNLLKEYYNRLILKGVDSSSFTWEECWERYKIGGIERWLQLLTYMALLSIKNPEKLPDEAMSWFHSQVHSFIVDHFDSCKQIPGLITAYMIR